MSFLAPHNEYLLNGNMLISEGQFQKQEFDRKIFLTHYFLVDHFIFFNVGLRYSVLL